MENSVSPDSEGPISKRMREGNVFAAHCRSREVMKKMTSSWSVLCLVALKEDTLRFSTLRRKIGGVSERMLAQTLKTLEKDGLVTRLSYDVVPPRVEYSLTALGVEASVKIADLANWIEENVGLFTRADASKQSASSHE